VIQTTNIGLNKVEGTDNWRTIFADYNQSMDIIEQVLSRKVIVPSTPIPIPSGTVFYNLEGLTINHVVDKWQFSSSAENHPPCDLTITTYDGYFSVTNSNGSTTETICPVFVVPITSAIERRSAE